MIVHFYNAHQWADPEAARRQEFARRTWSAAFAYSFGVVPPRTSAELGDDRPVPFVRDLFDRGLMAIVGDGDVLVFTNSDVAVVLDFTDRLREQMPGACWYGHRFEVGRFDKQLCSTDIPPARGYVGADAFAFTAAWWRERRGDFPDVLLGCEGWDCVLKMMMEDDGFVGDAAPIIYHEQHVPYWSRRDVIHANPGQVHNRDLCARWAREHGHGERIITDGRPFLFR